MHRRPERIENLVKLPPPTVESWFWQAYARCRGIDSATFFETDSSGEPLPDNIVLAKTICQGCSVRAECLEYALEAGEQFGVWGGLTARERRQYKWFH